MDSTINLLPTKDKQLKRAKPAQPEQLVEMTKPEERVFQERVVRAGGVLEFFKRLLKKTPRLQRPKATPPPPPPSKLSIRGAQSTQPVGSVTRMETMADRIPMAPKPAANEESFFSRIFSKSAAVPKPAMPVPPPPPRKVVAVPAPPPPPVRRPAWNPPPAPPTTPRPVAPPPPPPPPPIRVAPPPPVSPPPLPVRAQPVAPPPPGQTPNGVTASALNVNLVPEEFLPESSPESKLYAAIIAGGALLLVTVAWLGLFLYQRNLETKVQKIDDKIAQVSRETLGYDIDLKDATVLKQRTSEIRTLLSQHVYWDEFFKRLEAITLPNVTYTTMSVDVSGSVTLNANAKTFNDVGDQLLTYQRAKDFIVSAEVSTATIASIAQPVTSGSTPPGQAPTVPESVVSFSVALRVVPTIFYR